MIALHAVTKRYGLRAPVLRDIDLELPGASVVGVEGENGAGKSTLLAPRTVHGAVILATLAALAQTAIALAAGEALRRRAA